MHETIAAVTGKMEFLDTEMRKEEVARRMTTYNRLLVITTALISTRR